MRGKGTRMRQNEIQTMAVKELKFDITGILEPETRQTFLRHIIASFQESKKARSSNNIKFTVDLLPEEVRLFQEARDNQGKRLFEIGGTVKNTILHIEWHTFYCL